jgi:signal transduction histidine kinase
MSENAAGRLARAVHPALSRFPAWSVARRMVLASAVLAALVAAAFALLLFAISALRHATTHEARSKDLTAATLVLETRVLDLETGQRGFVITGDPRFLQPWAEARRQLPAQLVTFERLASMDRVQSDRARALGRLIRAYVRDFSVPLVEIARDDPAVARTNIVTAEGKQRIDAIRARFASFLRAEDALAAQSASSANRQSDRAIGFGAAGLVASAALIVLFGVYLSRSIGRPVRRVAQGASELAAGDFSRRLPQGGPGEVGELTESFNAMAERLEQGRIELETQNLQLRESEQLKSELVSIVSHEVRTPLASVLGFTSLLLRRDLAPETRRRYLEIIHTQGRRLSSLLDDFLDIQRIEEGRLDFANELVDLTAVLREQVELFGAQSHHHRLQLSVSNGRLRVRGDFNRLAQVVGNLISNAIKYSPAGGVVEIVGQGNQETVRVTVRDEGVGIPEDQQERVFTKFFRGEAATGGIPGTGLGLAFSRAIVEAHGGRISFTSAAGHGSTFWLELPAALGEL